MRPLWWAIAEPDNIGVSYRTQRVVHLLETISIVSTGVDAEPSSLSNVGKTYSLLVLVSMPSRAA